VIFKVIGGEADGCAGESAGEFFQGIAYIAKAGLVEVSAEAGLANIIKSGRIVRFVARLGMIDHNGLMLSFTDASILS
jgi:hypothetical protein